MALGNQKEAKCSVINHQEGDRGERSRLTGVRVGLMVTALLLAGGHRAEAQNVGDALVSALREAEVVDLTVLISEQLPAHWPTHAPFQRWTFNWFKPVKSPYDDNYAQSAFPYYGQRYVLDEHTGTQLDCPAHFIHPRAAGCPSRGRWGR